ncbi:MAG: UDP-N-acetylglucosamine 2-epimerase [Spirochaetes bacterium]|nr:UDP-N-acetylglucosamine 2-epimerase [Spirochaetota bacterium]
MKKRKICVVVASRANYGRVKYLMKAINNHPDLELQIIVGASIMLYRFGKAIDVIKADGFEPNRTIYYVVEGETLTTQAKSTGLGIIEIATALEDLNPDLVVTVADRFETMATAIAVAYLNIPLVHVQGGEISGNIDEKVRHAITKLSEIHFPATEKSKKRLIKMGENPDYIFNFGCPGMDTLVENDLSISNEIMSKYGGVGSVIDWEKPYILMVQHPVTTSYGEGLQQVTETLLALKELSSYQKIVLWPNIDAGTDDVSKGIRVFREKNSQLPFHFFRNFSPEDYARVLNNAKCTVGNSSSFIREGSFLGIPSVIVGDRQEDREHGQNIIFANYDRKDIYNKIEHQLKNKKYENEKLFGSGNAGKFIADKLAKINLNIKKRMTY